MKGEVMNKTNSESFSEVVENNEIHSEVTSFEVEKGLIDIYKHSFIETPFAERFQNAIHEVKRLKKWAIIGAYSRNGKSWCIKDIVKNSGAKKTFDGKTTAPVLAIRSPESSTSSDLISSLCRCFGKLPQNNAAFLKKWLIDNIPNFGVEQISLMMHMN